MQLWGRHCRAGWRRSQGDLRGGFTSKKRMNTELFLLYRADRIAKGAGSSSLHNIRIRVSVGIDRAK